MRYVKRCIELVGLCVLIAACSTIQTIADSTGARDAIQIATLFAIEQSSDRQATAREIIEVAQDAKAAFEVRGVSLDAIVDEVRERIARSDAELSKKAALNILLTRAERELRGRIEAGEVPAETRLRVNEFLDWIIDNARVYAG